MIFSTLAAVSSIVSIPGARRALLVARERARFFPSTNGDLGSSGVLLLGEMGTRDSSVLRAGIVGTGTSGTAGRLEIFNGFEVGRRLARGSEPLDDFRLISCNSVLASVFGRLFGLELFGLAGSLPPLALAAVVSASVSDGVESM